MKDYDHWLKELYKTAEERKVTDACIWLVDNKATIRDAADQFGFSKTTFWRRIHTVCKDRNPCLYKAIKRQLRKNVRNRRGLVE